MLRSVANFKLSWGHHPDVAQRAIIKFLHAIEKTLGFEFVVDVHRFPYHKPELVDLFLIAQKLANAHILKGYSHVERKFPDEPPFFHWVGHYAKDDSAGGLSATSERNALAATLAESLERHLWRFDRDFFRNIKQASESEMENTPHIPLARFAGFTEEQRCKDRLLTIVPETRFTWICGTSLLSGKKLWLPAQTVSSTIVLFPEPNGEPFIRPVITTGLATGRTKTEALLGGALEVIERDAYMIMWLNQLMYPRIDMSSIKTDAELSSVLEKLKRYRLALDVVRLKTDAPTYVYLACVRDLSEKPQVPISIGMSADCTPTRAIAHAILEALRARTNARGRVAVKPEDIDPSKILHVERSLWWLTLDRAEKLAKIFSGPLEKHSPEVWEDDSPEEHLSRILAWCGNRGYECATVDLGCSNKNPTSWHVHFVVIPELQPVHMIEANQCIGGARISEVPRLFGHTPRTAPFTDAPHPFS